MMTDSTELPSGNTHYVDNVQFQVLLVERFAKLREMNPDYDFDDPDADRSLLSKPVVSHDLGSILLQIAQNLSYRRNFINYSFREEMVGDGVENCLKYIDNYNCREYHNPFAYFTQTCFYAFVRRINKEDKQSEVKGAVYDKQVVEHEIHDKYEFQNAIVDSYHQS